MKKLIPATQDNIKEGCTLVLKPRGERKRRYFNADAGARARYIHLTPQKDYNICLGTIDIIWLDPMKAKPRNNQANGPYDLEDFYIEIEEEEEVKLNTYSIFEYFKDLEF